MFTINNHIIKIENKNGSMIPSPYSLLLAKNIPKSNKVLDLGCGSGLLGIVSCLNGSKNITMSDISENSLLDSKLNCELNNMINCKFIQSDLFKNINDHFDLILCNPPSLPSKKCNKQEYSSGKDGRKIINRILTDGKDYLEDNGKIIITHTSLANLNKTIKMIKNKYNYKIIDQLELKIRDFYDLSYILSLNNYDLQYPLYIVKNEQHYEIIYILQLTKKN